METEEKPTVVIAEDAALAEFVRFTSTMRLLIDVESLQGEDLQDYTDMQNRIISSIMTGKITITDKGEPVVHAETANREKNCKIHPRKSPEHEPAHREYFSGAEPAVHKKDVMVRTE